jgi:Glycosyltransferase family 87/Dolichyl-phosphate-mannose-protein mannosyltransferase
VAARQQLSHHLRPLIRAVSAHPAALVFVVALAVWWIQDLVIPLTGGRDLATYLGAYVQLGWSHPVDIGYVLGRTPLSPLVVGGMLDLAHGDLLQPFVSVLYAGSIVAWFVAARTFSRRASWLTAVVLLLYPGYGILFHEWSSDAVFAAAFAGWSLLVVRAMVDPTWRKFALVGVGIGILVLIRPSNQVLLVLVLAPLLLSAAWKTRVRWAVAAAVPAFAIVGALVLNNGLRYHDYIVVRGGNATVPFFRAFVTDKIVEPSNGPATRELAAAVRRDLLPHEPYRSYGITLDKFFHDASPRMETDLVWLSDRIRGWYTNDRWLRDVGVEAVRAHEQTYTRGVAGSVWGMLTDGLYRAPPAPAGTTTNSSVTSSTSNGPTVVIDGKRLPQPSEGEPIPAAYQGGITTPDNSIFTVWTSPSAHHEVFVRPRDAARNAALHRRMDELASNLPDESGSASLAHRFNQASRWFLWPALWLGLALIALIIRRPRRTEAMAIASIGGLLVIIVSAAGLPAEPHYSVPVAPAFVLLASGAFFAPRGELELSYARRVAGIAVGALAALWAAWIYAVNLDGTAGVGHDLGVFLQAASKVTAGASPYAFQGDRTYAYPPLLGFLAEPFHAMGFEGAGIAWAIVSLAAIALALWLLGLRDWRCYALTAVYPMTRSSIDLGTVDPFLLLGVAVAWRWRGRVLPPAAAVGTTVVLKLFLWPLVVWLALMRRLRSAAAAVGLAVALAFVSWAAIAFAGIGHYPDVLRKVASHESSSSYSVVALGVRAHLPLLAARIVSVLVALAFLVAAAWTARDDRRSARDRDVATLTLSLAAALAASPIVWMHYFVLLLVPIALTRPRLSILWFVPLAYYPLGESAWPAGDARKLAIGLFTTLVILGGTLFHFERGTVPARGLSLGNGARLRLSAWSKIRSGA